MGTVRLWELARDLDMGCRELTQLLAQRGVDAPSSLSTVDDAVADELRTPNSTAPPSPRCDPDGRPLWSPTRRHAPWIIERSLLAARPFWPRIGLLFLIDLLATPLLLLAPVPLKLIIDTVLGSQPLPGWLDALTPGWLGSSSFRLLLLAALLQVLVVLLAEAQTLASWVMRTGTGERLTLDFRARLFRHVQRLSILFHDARGTADSIYRVQYDAPALQFLTIDGVVPLATSIVTLFVTISVIAALDVQLALVALAVTPCLALLAREFNTRMRPRYSAMKVMESDALHVVHEVVSALRIVKAFGREDNEHARFVERSEESTRARIRLSLAEGAFGLLVRLVTAVGTAAVLFVGVRRVQAGSLTTGDLIIVVAYLAQLYAPLQTISQKVALLQYSLASAERAFELLDELPEVPEAPDARPLASARGDIELREMAFGYDEERSVLEATSLKIPAGARIGIAGRTGAGKTTLVSLLTRFFDPTAGSILLDGVDVRDYRLADLRNQFAIVPQDTVLFSTSIAENIAYARPDASHDEIVEAARAAEAHDFICGLPEGYETLVGERGMRLSGGERQRVALARAFLKDAPVLILDEPTSSIDVKTEAAIMTAMERLMAGRTTVMIAHRLSTLDVCDIVYEVDHGNVRRRPEMRRHEQRRAGSRSKAGFRR